MKNLKKVLAVLLAVGMLLCFCACGGNNDDEPEQPSSSAPAESNSQPENDSAVENKASFTVKVVDEGGNPVSGVMVQVCKDACVPARTDDNGVAVFNIEITDGYKLSVMSCPEGYEYTGEEQVYLDNGATDYTLELKAVS